jgi:2-succinyl-5-enolpyruvyl-6-hydroxy-3-cyclohexene-1-carboxylate synthase
MKTSAAGLNAVWAELIVEELVRTGCEFFCLSPGSRNTPLVAAVAEHERAVRVVHYDERGTAFHALGWARAVGRPAVLICTSGTAAANFLPAVVEASQDLVPLLLLTADRPPELRHAGANQAIDQIKMYGGYVRWFCHLPCPTEEIIPEAVLTTVDQAVYRAVRSPAGPVHVNCQFREPLAPVGEEEDFRPYLWSVEQWRQDTSPYTDYTAPQTVLDDDVVKEVADVFNSEDEGILVVGRLRDRKEKQAVEKLVRRIHWPVLADIGSGLRLAAAGDNIIAYYDLLMTSDEFVESWSSAPVIHIGGVPVSKRWQQFVSRYQPPNYIMIADHPLRHDPDHRVTARLETDIAAFCDKLTKKLRKKERGLWLDGFVATSQKVEQILRETIDAGDELSEPAVARLISQHIRPGSGLFLANSMPVRDMDMFADPDGPEVTVGCNRGASGIDGTIAAAAGFARGLGAPVTLLIGDLAFLHDINSLALLRSQQPPVIVVVTNNDGGGIFSFLPVAQLQQVFEPFFVAPHGLSFEKAAEMFGLDYACPDSQAAFTESYRTAQEKNRSTIIEIKSDRQENYRLHQMIEDRIKTALSGI